MMWPGVAWNRPPKAFVPERVNGPVLLVALADVDWVRETHGRQSAQASIPGSSWHFYAIPLPHLTPSTVVSAHWADALSHQKVLASHCSFSFRFSEASSFLISSIVVAI